MFRALISFLIPFPPFPVLLYFPSPVQTSHFTPILPFLSCNFKLFPILRSRFQSSLILSSLILSFRVLYNSYKPCRVVVQPISVVCSFFQFLLILSRPSQCFSMCPNPSPHPLLSFTLLPLPIFLCSSPAPISYSHSLPSPFSSFPITFPTFLA